MNEDVLVGALASIVRDPSTWDQHVWARRTACGTAFCMAGHIVHNSGQYEFVFDPERSNAAGADYADWVAPVGASVDPMFPVPRHYVPSVAARLLDVSELDLCGSGVDDDWDLFAEENTLGDLFRISAELLGVSERALRSRVAKAAAELPDPATKPVLV